MSREFLSQIRQPRTMVNGCLFFLMVVVFFPLTMTPEVTFLRSIAPGLVWIAMLLALFLSSDSLFQEDYDEGILEQWLVSGQPISVRVFAKVIIHWLFTLLPMLFFCPFLAILFSLTVHETWLMALSLVLGTPAILFLCALASAFGAGRPLRGTLMALILFPLTLPIMIFGSGTLSAAMEGLAVNGHLAFLTAMSVVVSAFMPFAVAGVIRVGLVD